MGGLTALCRGDATLADLIRAVATTLAREPLVFNADLHVWRVGKGSFACALTVVTADPAVTPGPVRQQLAPHYEIVHVTIEVQRCS